MRIGQGFDAHRLVAGRRLVIGGVEIPHDRGLAGHSDGDVLLHAVTDALLGALGQGDLGSHFPSSDPSLAGIDSGRLLAHAVRQMRVQGFEVGNLDATVIAEVPRLAPHQAEMRKNLSEQLGLGAKPERVNVKVTSSDGLGALGRAEGIAALAVVLLEGES